MNDQTWAVIIGFATVVGLRIIDFFFPKGKWFTWGGNVDEDEEKDVKKSGEQQDHS